MPNFESPLPGGSLGAPRNKFSSCQLDVIYCRSLNVCFVVDCLKWDEMHLVDFPFIQRLELLKFYMSSINQCPQLRLVEYLPLNIENVTRCYYGPLLYPYLNN